MQLHISSLRAAADDIEVVERKGLGHPDTICDALAETFSRNLCRGYLDRFGEVLHHNVDKALLCGGSAEPAFGGGRIIKPIEIILAGRAVGEISGMKLPIEEIAVEGSRSWLRSNLHALDADRHVNVTMRVAPGSANLQALFERGGQKAAPRANDTSFGVGYAPYSALESLVLDIECQTNGRDRHRVHAAWGEDVKVMAVRRGHSVSITIACAMVGQYLSHIDDYFVEKQALSESVVALARAHGFADCLVAVNLADDVVNGQCYMTVTGTSAEAGDDGEVGRGNRINGLITPCRPMSLEAAAGKNPVNHVGKLYNVTAKRICENLVGDVSEVIAAECMLVGGIGRSISEPACVEIKLCTHDGIPPNAVARQTKEIVDARLAGIPTMLEDFIDGKIQLF